jgi:hypothetical protein
MFFVIKLDFSAILFCEFIDLRAIYSACLILIYVLVLIMLVSANHEVLNVFFSVVFHIC